MMLNATKAPFNHLSARQAFAYAVDRDIYNKLRNGGILTNATGLRSRPGRRRQPRRHRPAEVRSRPRRRPRRRSTSRRPGKDLTFTLDHTADPSTTQDAVLVQQMVQQNAGIKVQLNSVPDQSTLINVAIGRQFDATLWRNHPGADDDTQYVWWHCGNSPAAGHRPERRRRVRQPGQLRRVQRPDHQHRSRQGPLERRPGRAHDALRGHQPGVREAAVEPAGRSTRCGPSTYKPNVHGIARPEPSRTAPAPFPGLPTGHPVDTASGATRGKC